MQNIEIQPKRQTGILIVAVVFLLALGGGAIWALTRFIFPQFEGALLRFRVTAIVILAVVPLTAIYWLVRNAAQKGPALIVDKRGITDHSNVLNAGFVPWEDIIAIREATNLFKHRLIVVEVRNPDTIIARATRLQDSLRAQHAHFGSPVVISANRLDYDTGALLALLTERLAARNASQFDHKTTEQTENTEGI